MWCCTPLFKFKMVKLAVKKGVKRINWPIFVSIPNDLLPGSHKPSVGMKFRLVSFRGVPVLKNW